MLFYWIEAKRMMLKQARTELQKGSKRFLKRVRLGEEGADGVDQLHLCKVRLGEEGADGVDQLHLCNVWFCEIGQW